MRTALAVLLNGAAGITQAITITVEQLADLLDPAEYRLTDPKDQP